MFSYIHTIRKRFAAVALLVMVMMSGSEPSIATPQQAFLKVNQCYIVYTLPIVPYVDSHGHFLASVGGFGAAINATTSIRNGIVILRYNRHSLKMVVGKTSAIIQSLPVQLLSAPTALASGAVVVPVVDILRGFHLNFQWVQKRHELDVVIPNWHLPPKNNMAISLDDWKRDIIDSEMPGLDHGQLAITALAMEPALPMQFISPQWTKKQRDAENRKTRCINLIFENVTQTEFPNDSVYINVYGDTGGFANGIGGYFQLGSPSWPWDLRRPNPHVLPGGKRGVYLEISTAWIRYQPPNPHAMPLHIPPTPYVLVWLVTREPRHR